jgi:AraC-like DNA-binding protein
MFRRGFWILSPNKQAARQHSALSLALNTPTNMKQLPIQRTVLEYNLSEPIVEYFPPTGFLYLNLYGIPIRQTPDGAEKNPDADPFLRWKTGGRDWKDFKPRQIIAGGMLSGRPAEMESVGRSRTDVLILHPLAAYHFLKDRLDVLTNGFADLRDLIGLETEPLIRQLEDGRLSSWNDQPLQQYFLKRLGDPQAWADDPVFHAVNLIIRKKGQIRMKELAAAVFMSERNLERQFLQKVGISPKAYAGNWRFQHALQLLQNRRAADTLGDLVDLAGYYDISHFMKDLKEKTGDGFGHFLHAVPDLMQRYLEVVGEK